MHRAAALVHSKRKFAACLNACMVESLSRDFALERSNKISAARSKASEFFRTKQTEKTVVGACSSSRR